MSAIEHLGLALALATLAGLNIYLTAFLVGLAARLGWFPGGECAGLEILSSPAVMGAALVLFLVEFLVDKVPWADSLWDGIHTILRPAAGALLAMASLAGDAGTATQFGIALLGVVAALLSHSTKAGLRLRINTSPEPFSNVGASVVEDVLVVAGFSLAMARPALALPVFVAVLAVCVLLAPGLWRSSRAIVWLVWKKLRAPAETEANSDQQATSALARGDELALRKHLPRVALDALWAEFCVSGKSKVSPGLRPNRRGVLVLLEAPGGSVYFVRRSGLSGRRVLSIELAAMKVTHESRFLSEVLVLQGDEDARRRMTFHFHRGQFSLVDTLVEELLQRIEIAHATVGDDPAAPSEDVEGLP